MFLRVSCALAVALCCGAASGQDSGHQDFLSWAGRTLAPISSDGIDAPTADLQPLNAIIGDARIVSLSEAAHGAAEPLDFRNRLFKFLVEELGFTTIAIESGIVEGRAVNDYILGGSGTLESALEQGIGWTFDRYPQNRELIHWMREHNLREATTSKLQFFGFDVPGSPANSQANRGPETALQEALRYLQDVDPNVATDFRERLEPVAPYLYFDPIGTFTPPTQRQYTDLTAAERDLLTGIVADLVALLERRRTMYTQNLAEEAEDDYEWALRAAIGARQMDDFLRRIPLGWSRANDGDLWFEEALLGRDLAMSENMQGAHLKRLHGEDVVTIGNLISGGQLRNCLNGRLQQLPFSPEPILVSDLFAQASSAPYLLDLRDAPPQFDGLLGTTREVWQPGFVIALTMNTAFDIAYFAGSVTPACVQ